MVDPLRSGAFFGLSAPVSPRPRSSPCYTRVKSEVQLLSDLPPSPPGASLPPPQPAGLTPFDHVFARTPLVPAIVHATTGPHDWLVRPAAARPDDDQFLRATRNVEVVDLERFATAVGARRVRGRVGKEEDNFAGEGEVVEARSEREQVVPGARIDVDIPVRDMERRANSEGEAVGNQHACVGASGTRVPPACPYKTSAPAMNISAPANAAAQPEKIPQGDSDPLPYHRVGVSVPSTPIPRAVGCDSVAPSGRVQPVAYFQHPTTPVSTPASLLDVGRGSAPFQPPDVPLQKLTESVGNYQLSTVPGCTRASSPGGPSCVPAVQAQGFHPSGSSLPVPAREAPNEQSSASLGSAPAPVPGGRAEIPLARPPYAPTENKCIQQTGPPTQLRKPGRSSPPALISLPTSSAASGRDSSPPNSVEHAPLLKVLPSNEKESVPSGHSLGVAEASLSQLPPKKQVVRVGHGPCTAASAALSSEHFVTGARQPVSSLETRNGLASRRAADLEKGVTDIASERAKKESLPGNLGSEKRYTSPACASGATDDASGSFAGSTLAVGTLKQDKDVEMNLVSGEAEIVNVPASRHPIVEKVARGSRQKKRFKVVSSAQTPAPEKRERCCKQAPMTKMNTPQEAEDIASCGVFIFPQPPESKPETGRTKRQEAVETVTAGDISSNLAVSALEADAHPVLCPTVGNRDSSPVSLQTGDAFRPSISLTQGLKLTTPTPQKRKGRVTEAMRLRQSLATAQWSDPSKVSLDSKYRSTPPSRRGRDRVDMIGVGKTPRRRAALACERGLAHSSKRLSARTRPRVSSTSGEKSGHVGEHELDAQPAALKCESEKTERKGRSSGAHARANSRQMRLPSPPNEKRMETRGSAGVVALPESILSLPGVATGIFKPSRQ